MDSYLVGWVDKSWPTKRAYGFIKTAHDPYKQYIFHIRDTKAGYIPAEGTRVSFVVQPRAGRRGCDEAVDVSVIEWQEGAA